MYKPSGISAVGSFEVCELEPHGFPSAAPVTVIGSPSCPGSSTTCSPLCACVSRMSGFSDFSMSPPPSSKPLGIIPFRERKQIVRSACLTTGWVNARNNIAPNLMDRVGEWFLRAGTRAVGTVSKTGMYRLGCLNGSKPVYSLPCRTSVARSLEQECLPSRRNVFKYQFPEDRYNLQVKGDYRSSNVAAPIYERHRLISIGIQYYCRQTVEWSTRFPGEVCKVSNFSD